MHYIMSDIHGCYQEFLDMLELIQFSDNDVLYIVGDIVDRGKDPIPLLLDLMNRINVYPILGNHDFLDYKVLSNLSVEITEENAENYLTQQDIEDYILYISKGGATTAKQFAQLSNEQKEAVLDYLSDIPLYETITIQDEKYILVHAGLGNFKPAKQLDDYTIEECILYRIDYSKQYYDSHTTIITGHTPTFTFRKDQQGRIYHSIGHLAIDCGCVFGHSLGCICLETQKEYYIPYHKQA